MKNFNELTNYEKITLSVDEIGLDEEQTAVIKKKNIDFLLFLNTCHKLRMKHQVTTITTHSV